MKITCEIDGGFAYFPALAAPMKVDTEALDPQGRYELEALVAACRFFELPPEVGTLAAGAADHRTYNITVQSGARSHSVRLTEPVEDSDLRKLLASLKPK